MLYLFYTTKFENILEKTLVFYLIVA